MAAGTPIEKGRSPFCPGRPVPPEMFVGRDSQIKRVLRAVRQTTAGKQENLFVTGEYGIGKSSLVSYVRFVAEEDKDLIGFHVFLGGVTSVDGMVQQVVSRIIQHAHRSKILEKVRDYLGKYCQSVELFGVRLNMEALRRDAPEIAQNFLPFLRQIWHDLSDEYRGIALYLDDLNGLAGDPGFAALLKSLVDEIATSGEELPLLLALVGVPERRLEIVANQRPVERIFDIVEVSPLDEQEVGAFFRTAFRSANMEIHEDALEPLVHYSGGLPKLMHELGEAVFWLDDDSVVDLDDAMRGLVEAADVVGGKYFEHIRRAVRSSDYHSIIRKLGDLRSDLRFARADLAKGLSDEERRKLGNFLQRMKKLHALHRGEFQGEWIFPNRLVQFYLVLEAAKEQGTNAIRLPNGVIRRTARRQGRRRR